MPNLTPIEASVRTAHYSRVFFTFFRNGLVREMTFRGNFILEILTSAFWFTAQITLFHIIYRNVDAIQDWSREQYFAFMATGMLINAIVEMFFMPNCAEFCERIRTGNLDFVLLKPIDPQFLISFEKMDLTMVGQLLMSLGLLGYAAFRMTMTGQFTQAITPLAVVTYLVLLAAGVAFFYSLMLTLACTSLWFGRNTGLYDFWFYVTAFARYPASVYSGTPSGEVLRFAFSYIIPILLVVTVPARVLLGMALEPSWLTWMVIGGALAGLLVSRVIFQWSLRRYRSASS